MSHDIGLSVVANMDNAAILRKKLAYGVVTSNAAVLTKGYNDLVL